MSIANAAVKPTVDCMAGVCWIGRHLDELVRAHPNQWVAVHRDRVVGADADLGRTTENAEKCAPGEDIAYHFVDNGTLIF